MDRAEITQEQVEREKLFERLEKIVEYLEGAPWSRVHPYPGPPSVTNLAYAADLKDVLRLARLTTPKAAALEKAELALREAARLHAQSIKGEDHGK